MFRKLLESFSFIHHQPPISIPLRKAIIMSLNRPVVIGDIEKYILEKYTRSPEDTLINLQTGIEYLRKERFFKRDASNLFVAGLRAIASRNNQEGINFGLQNINDLPDDRAIRTMITYMCRVKMYEEALKILNLSRITNTRRRQKKEFLQFCTQFEKIQKNLKFHGHFNLRGKLNLQNHQRIFCTD